MSRTLPARPSLVQLRHQAKDLRIAAREGAADALESLRQLRRFSEATKDALRSERVSLSEAQFALALDYGFKSWSELKAHVESSKGAALRAVRRADGSVVVAGLEQARWGGGTRRQCSTIATLSLVSEYSGDDTDYDYLMGASGAAFRVQMSEGLLCPSSPHAACGFACATLAVHAWGNDVSFVATDADHQADREQARAAIIASIERGVPVLYEEEESSLIVGYTTESLLLRGYNAREPGYTLMEKWPWRIGIASAKLGRPDARAVLEDSLELATELFETDTVGRYRCGRAAYGHWRELLADDEALARKNDQERFGAALGNAHTLECLADARSAASNYLASMSQHAPASARPSLEHAAAEYAEIERQVRECRRELAPFPWELQSPNDWSPALRQREMEALRAWCEIDEKAATHLKEALRACNAERGGAA